MRAQERPAVTADLDPSGPYPLADFVLRVRAMFITGTLKPEIEILFSKFVTWDRSFCHMDRRTYFADVVKASCEELKRVDVAVASYEKTSSAIGFAAGYFLRCLHVRQPDKVFKMLRLGQSVFC